MNATERLQLAAMLARPAPQTKTQKWYGHPKVLPPPPENYAIGQKWREYMRLQGQGLAKTSTVSYEGIMRRFLAWCVEHGYYNPADITTKILGEYILHLLNEWQLSANRVANHRDIILCFFDWLDYTDTPGVRGIRRRYLPKLKQTPPDRMPYTEEQFQRILKEAERVRIRKGIPSRVHREFWADAVLIGWHTGLRMVDIAYLVWPAVNFEEEIIRVRPRKTSAFRAVVEIPMAPELVERLLVVREKQRLAGSVTDYVLPDMAGYYDADQSYLPTQFRKITVKAGLPDHSFHSLRHGFVTRLLNSGADSTVVGSMTGQDVATIQTYAHVSKQRKYLALAAARKALHNSKLEAVGMNPTPANVEIVEI